MKIKTVLKSQSLHTTEPETANSLSGWICLHWGKEGVISGWDAVKGQRSAVGLCHPLGPSRLAGAGRGEDVRVADAELQVEEASGGGDAAVPGVGLLHRVAVLQGVDAHPGLVCGGRRAELSAPGEPSYLHWRFTVVFYHQ